MPEIKEKPISKFKKYQDLKKSGGTLITRDEEPVAIVLSFGEADKVKKEQLGHWLKRNPQRGIQDVVDHINQLRAAELEEETEA